MSWKETLLAWIFSIMFGLRRGLEPIKREKIRTWSMLNLRIVFSKNVFLNALNLCKNWLKTGRNVCIIQRSCELCFFWFPESCLQMFSFQNSNVSCYITRIFFKKTKPLVSVSIFYHFIFRSYFVLFVPIRNWTDVFN